MRQNPLELGVNFFDVAPAYGQGKAEAVLGRALQGRPEPVVVATKVRLAAEEMHDIAGAVRTSVEASLRRLRRETVDVLHIHNRFTPRRGDLPHSLSADDALGPVLDAYHQMQHAGKTRFIGISAMEPDVPTVRRLMTSGHFDTVLAYYNLLNWTAQEPAPPGVSLWDNGQIIPLATSLGMGVIGIRSHAAGALSPAGRPAHPTRDPAGARCGPCTDVGLPPGRSYTHLVAGGDGVLPDEPGHRDHRAGGEKRGGGGRTGGSVSPCPRFRHTISPACGHSMPGASKARARRGEPVRGGAHRPWTGGGAWRLPLPPCMGGTHGPVERAEDSRRQQRGCDASLRCSWCYSTWRASDGR